VDRPHDQTHDRPHDRLIAELTASAAAVPRLPHPAWRACTWLGVSVAYVALVAWAQGPRDDLALVLRDPAFVSKIVLGVGAAFLAACAALAMVVPGFPAPRRVALALATLAWLAWMVVESSRAGVATPDAIAGWSCFATVLVCASIPMVTLAAQLRRGAALAPVHTVAYAALASTLLADVGARLCDGHRDAAHLLVHVAALGVFTVTAAMLAPRVLRWQAH